ncbi:MAG: hypothetical protein SNJ71_04650, partial [Bacteroidales bacterium]
VSLKSDIVGNQTFNYFVDQYGDVNGVSRRYSDTLTEKGFPKFTADKDGVKPSIKLLSAQQYGLCLREVEDSSGNKDYFTINTINWFRLGQLIEDKFQAGDFKIIKFPDEKENPADNMFVRDSDFSEVAV